MEITHKQHQYYRGYILPTLSIELSRITGENITTYFLHNTFKKHIFRVSTMAGMSSNIAAWGFFIIRVLSLINWGIFLREPGEPVGVENMEFRDFLTYKMNQYEDDI